MKKTLNQNLLKKVNFQAQPNKLNSNASNFYVLKVKKNEKKNAFSK